MPARYCMFSTAVSTRRMTVNTPSRNTAGNTTATKGMNTPGDCDVNPIAISELDSVNTYNELRAAASLIVELAAVWSTKCSAVNADMNADCLASSSIVATPQLRPVNDVIFALGPPPDGDVLSQRGRHTGGNR